MGNRKINRIIKQRKDVEGSLFIYSRSSSPQYAFLILNRSSAENFQGYFTNTMELQITDPYIIFKNDKNEIYGLWFYKNEERKEFSNLFLK
jgi:mRNA-decapping enzyme 1B